MQLDPLVLNDEQRRQLEAWVRRPTTPRGLVLRARIVLLAAAGWALGAIARELGCRRATVRKWCRRFRNRGLAGLQDLQRSGRPRRISPSERCAVIATACENPEVQGLLEGGRRAASEGGDLEFEDAELVTEGQNLRSQPEF